MKVTMAQIAKEAGVSKVTVSNVMNRCGGVSDSKREEILALFKKYDYKPRPRKSKTKPSQRDKIGTVAVVLPASRNGSSISEYTNTFLSGVEYALKALSLDFLIATADDTKPIPDCIRENRVDGVIVTKPELLTAGLTIPVVRAFSPLISPSEDLILSDHETIGTLAARQLLNAGCTRCAFVNPHLHHQGFVIRKRTFIETLSQANVETIAVEDNYNGIPAKISSLVENVLHGDTRPDGLFIPGSDPEVVAIALELQRLGGCPLAGLKVVSCVSAMDQLEPMNLGMDFIDINLKDIGAAAVNTLLWRIKNPSAAKRRLMVLPSVIEQG